MLYAILLLLLQIAITIGGLVYIISKGEETPKSARLFMLWFLTTIEGLSFFTVVDAINIIRLKFLGIDIFKELSLHGDYWWAWIIMSILVAVDLDSILVRKKEKNESLLDD